MMTSVVIRDTPDHAELLSVCDLLESLLALQNNLHAALHDKLAELSADCFVEALGLLESGAYRLEPQDETVASYAPKLHKESGTID